MPLAKVNRSCTQESNPASLQILRCILSVLFSWPISTHLHCLRQFRCICIWTICTIKLASLEEFHLPSFGDSWTYCWRLLSICSLLAVWSKLNQQPIPSHLPHQRESCKQVSPAFVTYSTSFLMQTSLCSVMFELCDLVNAAGLEPAL